MGWKQEHANQAEQFAEHELIDDVLEEFAKNMGFELDGLPRYGLKKIVYYTAQVVLARAKGLDPDMLRISDDEFNEHQRKLMEMFIEAGKPVFVVVTPHDESAKSDPL